MSELVTSRSPIPNLPDANRCRFRWWGKQEEDFRRGTILAVLYLLPALWILQPVIADPDIWWHLQTGKWIVEHKTLPSTDPFSSYGEGKPWVPYSWLFEVGIYELFRLFGEGALIVYTLALVWLIMLMMHWTIARRVHHFVSASGLMAAAVIAMARLYTPRPWLLTVLFFILTLEVVFLLREGKESRWCWVLPLVYVVWANVHIQFIYGLGLLGLACLAPLVDQYVEPLKGGRSVMAWGSRQWKQLTCLTIVCVLATLINPHHVRLYVTVAQLSAQTGMWDYTQEMQAPTFRTIPDWAMLVLFALALLRFGQQRSWPWFEIILLAVAAVYAFRGTRDVWFLVIAAVAVLAGRRTEEISMQDSAVSNRILGVALVFLVFGVVGIMGYREFTQEQIRANTAKLYPIEAASSVESRDDAGPLYNHFDWGGYLIWRLPHLKVAMDGRANVHGDERIKQALATWTGSPGWKDDPELNEARIVIAKRDMALASLLRLDPRFHVAYEDQIAVVFSRSEHSAGDSPSSISPSSTSDTAVASTW